MIKERRKLLIFAIGCLILILLIQFTPWEKFSQEEVDTSVVTGALITEKASYYKPVAKRSMKKVTKLYKAEIKRQKEEEERKKAEEEAARIAAEEEAARQEAEAQQYYEEPTYETYSGGSISPSEFQVQGVVYANGVKYTWYSEKVLPGGGLNIPGRHVDGNGYVCDGDGYICVASCDYPQGTVLDTPFGPAKVYDVCPTSGIVDIYVSW